MMSPQYVPPQSLPDSPAKRLALVFCALLREAGWYFDPDDATEEGLGRTLSFWRGPGRCEPVYWKAQFLGLFKDPGKGQPADQSDVVRVWTMDKIELDEEVSIPGLDVRMSDPDFMEGLVAYLREWEGTI